jgi:hypothetical protein
MVAGGKILFINEIFMASFSIDLSWNLIKWAGAYKVSAAGWIWSTMESKKHKDTFYCFQSNIG